MSRNTIEWMIIDLANILYGYTTVPIAETSETTAVEAMLK